MRRRVILLYIRERWPLRVRYGGDGGEARSDCLGALFEGVLILLFILMHNINLLVILGFEIRNFVILAKIEILGVVDFDGQNLLSTKIASVD